MSAENQVGAKDTGQPKSASGPTSDNISATTQEPKNVIELKDDQLLRKTLEQKNQEVVLYFWAAWAEHCKQVDTIIQDLAKKYTKTEFFRIEAEKFEGVSEAYDISAVPTVIVAKKDKIIGRVDGVNIPKLVQQIADCCAATNGVTTQPAVGAAPADFKQDLNTRLKECINRAKVMVFIKGTPAQPRCGFSRKIVGLLNENKIKYGYFDILTDEEVRQGLKEYSDWPTYPQLYIEGELVGGLDIVAEMIPSGELIEMVPKESILS
ncbi:glutaredoxin [Coemansia guatemalensis]|uniref:Glutaredoxin n=1 Tax=Coemansia guatemalensis TaxID=2761395 RepID=A0A9W8LQ52_9FUNG|nr:glutaredoxin [Coemansia guatemalensis]